MIGSKNDQTALFSYVSIEQRIPDKHPLYEIRKLVDSALKPLNELLADLYSHNGSLQFDPNKESDGNRSHVMFTN